MHVDLSILSLTRYYWKIFLYVFYVIGLYLEIIIKIFLSITLNTCLNPQNLFSSIIYDVQIDDLLEKEMLKFTGHPDLEDKSLI